MITCGALTIKKNYSWPLKSVRCNARLLRCGSDGFAIAAAALPGRFLPRLLPRSSERGFFLSCLEGFTAFLLRSAVSSGREYVSGGSVQCSPVSWWVRRSILSRELRYSYSAAICCDAASKWAIMSRRIRAMAERWVSNSGPRSIRCSSM